MWYGQWVGTLSNLGITDVLYDNNSSNFTFVVDLRDFDLQKVETVNVESMNEKDVHGIDDFSDNNKVMTH